MVKPFDVRDLFIGTSGYSYGEWIDSRFYPYGTHSSNMFDIYQNVFNSTELNYTWYQMPKPAAIKRVCLKASDNFKFSVKLTRTMTHEIKKGEWQKEVIAFRTGIHPLVKSKKLLAVLIQLPPWFQRSAKFRYYLAALLDELAGLPIAVEFRHDSWVNEKVFSEFERRKVTLVSVDAPLLTGLFPKLDVVTNPDLTYIRLHGRNKEGWGSGSMQKQFDYCYSAPELERLAVRVKEVIIPQSGSCCIFFNNHVHGQAPENALDLKKILRGSNKSL